MTDPHHLREQLADIQHAIWAHWMRYLFSVCEAQEDGSYRIPAEKAARWQRQMNTPYTELSDKEKDSDREQADKIIPLIRL
ncbi:MAG: hypothetical protein JW750_12620 [Anaerolineaceae bacterium]|nr:hypothetical protein [Anaerolineaceae bacterium]